MKHYLGYGLLICLIVLFSVFWLQDYIGHQKAEAVSKAEKSVRTDLEKRMSDRESQYETERSAILGRIKQVKTPHDALRQLPTVIDLPAPIKLPETSGSGNSALPDAILPREDIKPLFDQLASCKLDRLELGKCKADNLDVNIKADSFQKEADIWKSAAKGGSKWHRFGKSLKIAGCAGGGAYLGSLSSNKSMGAAIGAIGGAGLCSLKF